MKRALPIKSLMFIGVGTSVAMWLTSKPNRIKTENILREWKRKINLSLFDKSKNLPIEKGGNPHPADVEDNKMVSEGAMYSVNYYNQEKQ